MAQIVKKPNYRVLIAMLNELLTLKQEGDCFVPFAPDDIQAAIDHLKLYSANK